jgi:hypothetical protein
MATTTRKPRRITISGEKYKRPTPATLAILKPWLRLTNSVGVDAAIELSDSLSDACRNSEALPA